MLRLGLLLEGYIYPREEGAVRGPLRERSQLVRQRTANLLSIQNLIACNTGASISVNRIKQLTIHAVGSLLADTMLGLQFFKF